MTIHTFQGYPTYIEVDAETGRTAVTFDFKTPGEAPLFAGFMGNIFNGVEVLVEIEEDIEEDPRAPRATPKSRTSSSQRKAPR